MVSGPVSITGTLRVKHLSSADSAPPSMFSNVKHTLCILAPPGEYASSVQQARRKQAVLNGTLNLAIATDCSVTFHSMTIHPGPESAFRLITDKRVRIRLVIFPPPNNTLHKDRYAILARLDEPAARVGIEFIGRSAVTGNEV